MVHPRCEETSGEPVDAGGRTTAGARKISDRRHLLSLVMLGRSQQILGTVAALLVACSTLALPISTAGAADALADITTTRYGGADRYATSLRIADAVAAEAGGTLDEVVLVSGRNWTDAVVAAPLAGHLGAAVLATPPGVLRADAAAFLKRVGVSTARLIGANSDTDGIGPTVVSSLGQMGIKTIRTSHSDQYTTAALVAAVIGEPGDMGDLGATAVVASGEVFADALVAGAFAARGSHPVLLTPADRLHDSAATYLRDLQVEHVVLMGGTAALSADVEAAISALDIEVTRLAGETRFDTAVKAAELTAGRYGSNCFTQQRVGLARARVPFDSFSAGPLLGRLCAPLLLTDPGSIPDDTAAHLDKMRKNAAGSGLDTIDLRVFGGDAAVSQAAIDRYAKAAGTTPPSSSVTCDIELGKKPVELLDGKYASRPAWSPDCRRVGFIGLNDEGLARLFTAKADGSDRMQVSDDSEIASFAWSPDGTRLAFSQWANFSVNGDSAQHLFVINADGSGRKQITRGNFRDATPTWSPDGARIAFARRDLESADTVYNTLDVFIAVVNAGGGKVTSLTRGGDRDDAPAWSPDGQRIAYNSDGSVWVIRADGSEPRLIEGGPFVSRGVTWSPAGDELAYHRLEFLEDGRRRSRLVRTSLDGSSTKTVASYSGTSGSLLRIGWPQWSPDGASILFERGKSGTEGRRAFAAAISD